MSVGDEEVEDALRRCLAMGADRAIRVDARAARPDLVGAGCSRRRRARESPDLVLCGVQSSRLRCRAATGAALAELLGLPRVAVVTRARVERAAGRATVDRELEGGLVDVVEVDTPALLTIQTGINQPRYANLRAIKQAEQKEIEVVSPAEPGEPAYRVRRMFAPPKGEAGARCWTVARREHRAADQGDRRGAAEVSARGMSVHLDRRRAPAGRAARRHVASSSRRRARSAGRSTVAVIGETRPRST